MTTEEDADAALVGRQPIKRATWVALCVGGALGVASWVYGIAFLLGTPSGHHTGSVYAIVGSAVGAICSGIALWLLRGNRNRATR